MKIIVFGANGQIGKILIDKIKKEGTHEVTAAVRKEEQAKDFQSKGVKGLLVDLEGSVEELTKVIRGHDAVVFSAGSGGKTGPDKTLLVDLDGAVKTMEAASKAGTKRYLMVSALQANNRKNWNQKIRPYYVAKHYADRCLAESGLDFTIVRPGGLTNDKGAGKVAISEQLERGKVSREDVATVLLASLEEEKTIGKAFDLTEGDKSFKDALGGL
ncbi:SDR family oxidoreductase [Pleomorphovibrio marinus]|uniref:SDR family oxidoreductase n=1 Tax=Pleomorphovibrio marinus TaxID=2164132 RepID=UPI000E0C3915|nr:SDR family oxidoreductase [Pleomorphovibrio marinus]